MKLARIAAVVAFAALVGVTGCTKNSNHDKFQGSWSVDLGAFTEANPELAKNKMALNMMQAMFKEMKFEVKKDSITMSGMPAIMGKEPPEAEVATYTVKSDEGKVLTIETVSKKGDKEKKETMKVEFIGADQVKMIPAEAKADDPVLVLKRN